MEKAIGKDEVSIGALVPVKEEIHYHIKWRIDKYNGDFHSKQEVEKAGAKPFEVWKHEGNCLLNEGINELLTLFAGAGGTPFDGTNTHIGVGDTPTPAALATQTGLQAPTNKYYQLVSAAPTVGSNQKFVATATFASANANFAWEEITVANGDSDSAKNLNRLVQAMGTKAVNTSWVATVTVTLV